MVADRGLRTLYGAGRVREEGATRERLDTVLRYLEEGLTRRLPVPGEAWAVLIYNETDDGKWYSLQPADDVSNQGDACVDDVSRAIVLACDVYRATGSPRAARLASRWSTFLPFTEIRGRPGVYAPFAFADGRLNIGGWNSRAPGKWAQGNAARAWARLWQTFGDARAAERFWEVERKATPDLKAIANRMDGDLTAYGVCINTNQVRAVQRLRPRITRDVERIMAYREPAGYFGDFAGSAAPSRLEGTVQLWGYHQLAAVARAARLLQRPDWLQACVTTVDSLIDPLLERVFPTVPYAWPVDANGHPLAWPDDPGRQGGTAYHVSCLVAGLAEVYWATGEEQYAERAVHIAGWLTGDNPAGESMYHPRLGGCYDGMTDGCINRNLGAESSIEAGRAELYRLGCEAKFRLRESTA